jgi:hypothetical protein
MKRRNKQKKSTPKPPKDSAAAYHRRVLRGAKAALAGNTDYDAVRAALSTERGNSPGPVETGREE